MTSEEFIKRAKVKHGDEYQYDKLPSSLKYIDKVIITCSKHGDFIQMVGNHLSGSGCPHCYGTFKKTTEQFIDEAKKVHGDKYDYSLTKYTTAYGKVKIICPVHGVFEQEAYSHLRGCGCAECVKIVIKGTDDFIEKAIRIYGDEYSYEKTNFVDSKTKLIVTKESVGDIYVYPLTFLKRKTKSKRKLGIRESQEIQPIEGEEWRDVVGYEEYYQVSNKGRVRSKDRISNSNNGGNTLFKGRILEGVINKAGYRRITLKIRPHSKAIFIHRLVAEAFIPNPNNYPIINHKDENPLNNCVENLEWCDNLYNNTYGNALKKAKETRIESGIAKAVKKIDLEGNIVAIYASKMLAAKIEGVNISKINSLIKNNEVFNGYRYDVYDKEVDGDLSNKITYFKG